MSCAWGTRVRTGPDHLDPVENLFEAMELFLGPRDQEPVRIIQRPLRGIKPCVRIKTDQGQELICTRDHVLLLPREKVVLASESLDQWICTVEETAKVIEVADVGLQRIVMLRLESPRHYESNGILSEE